jgi:restriction system protein
MRNDQAGVPTKEDLMLPTLRAVHALGGSGSIGEIEGQVASTEGLSEDEQAVPHLDGPQSELQYRLAWSRTYLKGMGFLDNSQRGVWSLTDSGEAFLGRADAAAELERLTKEYERGRRRKRHPQGEMETSLGELDEEQGWQDNLLEQLLAMSPDAFERLAQRLLREADFDAVRVTGGTNDKGIDGVGVYRLGLVTFPVFFQCKRYRGSVGSDAVRDFRGAMAGRGDKGLLIITSTFTAEAKAEASREGAAPIDLVDGARLCTLLKQYGLGVKTEMREHVQVVPDFFAQI